MKPMIGLVPLVDEEKNSYWMLPGYMNGITQAGGIPFMLPLTDDLDIIQQLVNTCDGFLLTGGQDVTPTLYGETAISLCGVCCSERDRMEQALLTAALAQDKSILGICRGIQFLNVALGGTLYQDIPTQMASKVKHQQKPPYHIPSHSVAIAPESPLYRVLKKEQLAVNSYHHQGIRALASSLRPMAWAPDGLVEAVSMPDRRFVWAVQWHPEFSYLQEQDSRALFTTFVASTKRSNI